MSIQDRDPILRGYSWPSTILIETGGSQPITIFVDKKPPIVVRGCPVPDGFPSCVSRCPGNLPGLCSKTTPEVTMLVYSLAVNPDHSACQPIQERIKEGLRIVHEEMDAIL